MTWALYHNLYTTSPGAIYQLTQSYKLSKLSPVSSIMNTARAHAISQRYSHVIFFTNIKNIIISSQERIFLLIMQHPASNKGTATAYNIHLAALLSHFINGIQGNTAMHSHEISAILSLLLDRVKHIIIRHFYDSTMLPYCPY